MRLESVEQVAPARFVQQLLSGGPLLSPSEGVPADARPAVPDWADLLPVLRDALPKAAMRFLCACGGAERRWIVLDGAKVRCRLWEPPAGAALSLRFTAASVRLVADLYAAMGGARIDPIERPQSDGDVLIFASACQTLRAQHRQLYRTWARISPLTVMSDPAAVDTGHAEILRAAHEALGPIPMQYLDGWLADSWLLSLSEATAGSAECCERVAVALRNMIDELFQQADQGAGPHVLAPAVRLFAGWLERNGPAVVLADRLYGLSEQFRHERRRHEMLDRLAELADTGKQLVAWGKGGGAKRKTASAEIFVSLFDRTLRPWAGAVDELAGRLWERQLA